MRTEGFDIQAAGTCLFAAGALDLAVNLALVLWLRDRLRAPAYRWLTRGRAREPYAEPYDDLARTPGGRRDDAY